MRASTFFAVSVFTSVLAVLAVPGLARAAQDAPPPLPPPAPAAQPAPAQPATPDVAPAPAAAPAPAPALATKDKDKPADAEPETRSVYIGFSPLHLILPVFEVTAEIKVHRYVGVGIIGGYGTVKGVDTPRFKVWEVGGQVVAYPVGHFDHGMQVGLEVLYLGLSGEDTSTSNKISGTASGLGIGPLIGYKLATQVGFTFNVQGGVQFIAARAEASSTSGSSASAEDSRVLPLVNANIGWSF